ncbi:MAG: hypothetical protein MUD08_11515 [Cytophagales bacterium]|nr:hypothetical protein [Cytophagales bacterium]
MDKQTLIAYLYGELSDAEAAQVRRFLDENPAAKAEWEALSATRRQLQQLPDEPVTEPLIFSPIATRQPTFAWRNWAAAAAGLVGVVLLAALFNVRISYRDHELAIRFGEGQRSEVRGQKAENRQVNQKNQVRSEVKNSIAENTETSVTDSRLTENVAKTSDTETLVTIAELEQKLQKQIQELRTQQTILASKKTGGATNEQTVALLTQLQQENYETMQQLLKLASQQQQQYSQQLLTQFSEYLETQRAEDLEKINAVLTNIVQNTDQKQEQTDYILTQLISKVSEKDKATGKKN